MICDTYCDLSSRDFSQEQHQKAALKNAFILQSRHDYLKAAVYFLLAGHVDESLQIIVKYAHDPQLALFLSVLLEGDQSPSYHAIMDHFIAIAWHQRDLLLQATCYAAISNLRDMFSCLFSISDPVNYPVQQCLHLNRVEAIGGDFSLFPGQSSAVFVLSFASRLGFVLGGESSHFSASLLPFQSAILPVSHSFALRLSLADTSNRLFALYFSLGRSGLRDSPPSRALSQESASSGNFRFGFEFEFEFEIGFQFEFEFEIGSGFGSGSGSGSNFTQGFGSSFGLTSGPSFELKLRF